MCVCVCAVEKKPTPQRGKVNGRGRPRRLVGADFSSTSPELQSKIIEEILDVHNFSHYIPPHNVGVMYISDNEIV